MKLIPSNSVIEHLKDQNVLMPEGGFDIPDGEYQAAFESLRASSAHRHEAEADFNDRVDYFVAWKFYGQAQNGSQRGVDLTNAQRMEALTRQIVQVSDTHLPNAAEKVSQAVEDSSKVIHQALAAGHDKVVSALADLKTFSGESHAEAIKIASDLHDEQIVNLGKIHDAVIDTGKLVGKWLVLAILFALLVTIFKGHAHAQGTPVIANQSNGAKLHMTCDSGCSGAGGSTTPTNAFANPTTAGLAMSFNAMWNGSSWDLVKGDTTSGLWVNCKSGCAGGSSTPTNTFANPTTAGLSQSFNMMWNGATWDLVKGDTTNGLWVNVKSLPALAAGSAVIGHVIVDTTSTTAVTQATGTNLHAVIDSGSTTAVTGNVASTVADGANVTLGAKADAKSTATDTTAVTIMQVLKEISAMEQAPASRAVTNAGTFATQSTLAAETTKVIGTVNISASQTVGIAAGSAVIGHVIADSGSTTAVTGNVTAVQATGSNLHVVVDTAPSTAVTNAGTFAVQAVGTLGDNGGAATTNRMGTLPAIAQATPAAAATAGRDAALLTDLHRVAYTSVMPTDVTSYTASKVGLASAASATDIAVLSGNASNTVIVTKVVVSCTQTTAGIIDLILLKRSTADTSGTSTGSPTTVPLDSSNAAGSSSVLTYTANPTTGSLVGNVDSVKLGCMATGTATPNDIYIWKPSMGQSIVLRGTAQQLAVNLNAATVTGGAFSITISWIEATNY